MLRQNRFVPILLVVSLAWLLYVAGCFDADEAPQSAEEQATVGAVAQATSVPVIVENVEATEAVFEEEFYHVVEAGDLLPTIAAKYSVAPEVILRANPEVVDANQIFPGQRLRVPGATTDNTALGNPGEDRKPGQVDDYMVQEGDSPGAIADLMGVSLGALLGANPGLDPSTLQIGSLLTVPAVGTGLTAEQLADTITPEPVQRDPFQPLYHHVKAGETLSQIAETYDVTEAQLMTANLIDNAHELFTGQRLSVPRPIPDP